MHIKSARDALKTALKIAIQKKKQKNPAEAAVELICIDMIGANIDLIWLIKFLIEVQNFEVFTTEQFRNSWKLNGKYRIW